MLDKKQKPSQGEQKAIDYAISKGLNLNEKKSYVYFVGNTHKSPNSPFYKPFSKEYTPDIEFSVNNQIYWVEIKGKLPFWHNRHCLTKECIANIQQFCKTNGFDVNINQKWYKNILEWFKDKLILISIEPEAWKEKKPLVIDYCYRNNIIFKEFSSSNAYGIKHGYNDYCKWIDSLVGDR